MGYGHIRVAGRIQLVHRVAAAVFSDFDLEGELRCLHRCDNPSCFNPEHLWFGTQADNVRDRDEKGRRVAPKGEGVGTSKLAERQVKQIIRRLQRGDLQRDVALAFGVSKAAVSRIAQRKTWAHVLPDEEIPAGTAARTNAAAKLTERQVVEIKRALARGENQATIAAGYGVSSPTISNIHTGRRWAHVPSG